MNASALTAAVAAAPPSPSALATSFFLAAAVVLVFCRVVQIVLARIGQAPVVAEMVAGVMLGPSLLGEIWPSAERQIFPADIRPVIYVIGQVGLAALMFGAGASLRGHVTRETLRSAALISSAGTLTPLALGVGLMYAAHGHAPVFHSGVSIFVEAAFVGVTLSVTAFPMLARIVVERGLFGQRHGTLALASGAMDDAAAWALLAGVLSLASGKSWLIIKAVGGALIFVAVVIFVLPPLLRRFLQPQVKAATVVLVTLSLLCVSAWYTDSIGLFAVFGAFGLGLAIPRVPAADHATPVMQNLSYVFVPMFFVYSGLNTHFSVFSSGRVTGFTVAAVAVAVVGKFFACYGGARAAREDRSTASFVGVLMNARGLMQLIALNIGLQAGLVTSQLFSSLVLVAIVTTLMTSPLLTFIESRHRAVAKTPAHGTDVSSVILTTVAGPDSRGK